MINDRPYRKALAKETVLNEIDKYSGSQFDPLVVKAFQELVKDNKIAE